MKKFGEMVREKRLALGHSDIKKFAEEIGGRPSWESIRKIENGGRPSLIHANDLIKALELSPHDAAHAIFGLEMTEHELTDKEWSWIENLRALDDIAFEHVTWATKQFADLARERAQARSPSEKKSSGRKGRAVNE